MRLYISYSQNDYSTAATIVDILRFSGHEPVFGHRLLQRRDWKAISKQSIESADVCVIMLSPHAVEAAECQFEWTQAFRLNKPVVPVLLKNCRIPAILHEIQYTDFSGDDILIAVAQLLGGLYVCDPGDRHAGRQIDHRHDDQRAEQPTDQQAAQRAEQQSEPPSEQFIARRIEQHTRRRIEAHMEQQAAQREENAEDDVVQSTPSPPQVTLVQPHEMTDGADYDDPILGFEHEIPGDNGYLSGQPLEYDPIFGENIPPEDISPATTADSARRHHSSAVPPEAAAGAATDRTPPPTLPEINMEAAPGDAEFPYEPELILIAAGQFIMGSDLRVDDLATEAETPQLLVTVDDFQIGRYPVTVNEYWAFVDEGGYYEASFWTDAGWAWREENNVSHPRYWDDDKWSGNGYLPVIGVSWYEAIAYTQWLSEITDQLYRLPTESEWEKAARGTDGRIFPWGDDWHLRLCNVAGGGMWRTTSVGYYSPDGDSPYGVSDMSGNVWEWCMTKWRDRYLEPEDNGFSGNADRCLRGGSWFSQRQDVRTTARARDQAGDRDDHLGFRVACGPMPILPTRL